MAYRIWTDNGDGYEPLMCGLMTSLPTNTSRGAGAFYAHPFTGDESAPVDQQIYIEWDRTDATHKWNLAYVVGTVDEGQNVVVDTAYARVDVRENDETGTDERTVRAAADFSVHPAGFETMQSSVHFQPGGGFFLLTAESTGAIIPFGVENVCVSLADASEATGGECDGFDTQDMTLLDVPIGDETAFPAEFAAVPTF